MRVVRRCAVVHSVFRSSLFQLFFATITIRRTRICSIVPAQLMHRARV